MPDIALSMNDLLLGIRIIISLLALIVLYHVLFIVVDLRKILRRVDDITEQVEAIILKPISLADQLLQKLMELIESATHRRKRHARHQKPVIEQREV